MAVEFARRCSTRKVRSLAIEPSVTRDDIEALVKLLALQKGTLLGAKGEIKPNYLSKF